MTEIHKRGYRIAVTEEEMLAAHFSGFEQKGHYEPVTPTPEQVAQHARAKAALEELESNPYISHGFDDDPQLLPLKTERWVADETTEEYLERWRKERATYTPPPSPFDNLAATMLRAALGSTGKGAFG